MFSVAGSVDKIGFKGNFSHTHPDGCIESTSIRNTQRSQHMEITYIARSAKRFGIVYVSRYLLLLFYRLAVLSHLSCIAENVKCSI